MSPHTERGILNNFAVYFAHAVCDVLVADSLKKLYQVAMQTQIKICAKHNLLIIVRSLTITDNKIV